MLCLKSTLKSFALESIIFSWIKTKKPPWYLNSAVFINDMRLKCLFCFSYCAESERLWCFWKNAVNWCVPQGQLKDNLFEWKRRWLTEWMNQWHPWRYNFFFILFMLHNDLLFQIDQFKSISFKLMKTFRPSVCLLGCFWDHSALLLKLLSGGQSEARLLKKQHNAAEKGKNP